VREVSVQAAEDQEVDRLFGLGPEAFVAARTEAARRLKKAGDAGAAARITALRRPPLSAWAVNQLARARGPEVEGLLEAGERLRAAHRAALAGEGAAELRTAARAEREAVAGLVAAAAEVLESTGHPATEATRDRVAATLHAAAADPDAAELVRRGRLTHDLDPAGFGTPDALDAAGFGTPDDGAEGAEEAKRGGPEDQGEAAAARAGAAKGTRAGAGAAGGRAVAGAGGAKAGTAAAGGRRGARGSGKGGAAAAPARDGRVAEDAAAAAATRARRLAAVAARDEARRRARLAADQAVLATRHAERLGRLADQAEREATRARATATAAIDAAAAARERATRASKELTEAERRLAENGQAASR
jgi:hypothetical protein